METVSGRALWFIESRLASGDELSLERIAGAVGVSTFHLCRAFAVATGQPVAVYTRARRLGRAAEALAGGAPDILGVALDAGYESHEAFTRAFRRQFQTTPESVRARAATGDLRLQEPLRMTPTTVSPLSAPRIVAHSELRLVGLGRRYRAGDNAAIPSQWSTFGAHIGHIDGEVPGVAYGVIYGVDAGNDFDYLCGVEVRGVVEPADGLVALAVPAHSYAVFEHGGHVSTIQATFSAIWERGLTEAGLRAAEAPVLERYDERFDPRTGSGVVEIWVPVLG